MGLNEDVVTARIAAEEGASAVFPLFQLAAARIDLRDPRAVEAGQQAVALAEAHGERWGRAHALWTLAYDAQERGDLEESLALMRAGLEIKRGFNEPPSAALMLETLARGPARRGQSRTPRAAWYRLVAPGFTGHCRRLRGAAGGHAPPFEDLLQPAMPRAWNRATGSTCRRTSSTPSPARCG